MADEPATVIVLPTTQHADKCPGCGRLARLFIFGRCERCRDKERSDG